MTHTQVGSSKDKIEIVILFLKHVYSNEENAEAEFPYRDPVSQVTTVNLFLVF